MKLFFYSILLLIFSSCHIISIYGQFKIVKNINQSSDISIRSFHCIVDNKLIFSAKSTDTLTLNTTEEVWVTDGTNGGTLSMNYPSLQETYTFSADSVMLFPKIESRIIGSTSNSNYALMKLNPNTKRVSKIKTFDTEFIYEANGELQKFAKSNGAYYFSAFSQAEGIELWKTDATTLGTILVKDIEVGTNNSSPKNFVDFNNQLYFSTIPSYQNSSLWKSDGTANGTIKIKDIGSAINKIVVSGSKLFIFTETGLWVSDGTESGTILLSNTTPDSNNAININSTLFFTFAITNNTNVNNNRKLYKSDGVSITLVKDFVPITDMGSISRLTNYNGILAFRAGRMQSAYYNYTTTELWRSDGTNAGTYMIKSINNGLGGCDPDELTVLGNTLYFSAFGNELGRELYRTDGTSQGTLLVKDISPPAFYVPVTSVNFNGNETIRKIVTLNNSIIMQVSEKKYGDELWRSDGTENGTSLIKDINKRDVQSSRFILAKTNNKIYFTADDGTVGNEVWETDGSFQGTSLVKDCWEGQKSAFFPTYQSQVLNNELFTVLSIHTVRNDGIAVGRELYKINLNTKELTLVKDILPRGNLSLKFMSSANNLIFFNPTLGLRGSDLWRSDGTDAGTYRLKDFTVNFLYAEQNNDTNIDVPIEYNGQLYFFAKENESMPKNLWKSDGTIQGTQKVKDFGNTTVSGWIRDLKIFKNKLYTVVKTQNLGTELWVSDGTTSGTINLLDINSGTLSSDPYLLASNSNYLYFIATDTQGLGLWKTDGTTQGTVKVSGSIGTFWSNGKGVIENDILYFIPTYYSNILYRSDGTQLGTYLINLPNTTNQQGLGDLIAFGNSCFLYLNTSNGIQFWRTNGTSDGTINLGIIFKNSTLESTSQITSYIHSGLTKFGNKIIFSVNDVYYGEEFWIYDTCELRETMNSGNWTSSNTWSCGQIPNISDEATINKEHTVSLNSEIFLKRLRLWGNINYLQNGKINLR